MSAADVGGVPVLMPKIGQVMEAGTIIKWLRADGDRVAAGDSIAEVETDKATYELEAPADGVLRTRVAEGEEVAIDTLIAIVEVPGAAPAASAPGAQAAAPGAAPAATPAPAAARQPARSGQKVAASPKARRLAAELGIDLAMVTPSGADGVISAEDVQAAANTPATRPVSGVTAAVTGTSTRAVRERSRLSAFRRAAARRLQESWTTIPHIVQMIDVDARGLLAERERLGAAGTPVSLNDLIIHTAAAVLARRPHLNGTVEGEDLVLFEGIDAGLAVEGPRGLVVPVVRGADRLSPAGVAAETRRLVAAARGEGLKGTDAGSASFTVSSLGAWGIRAGTPVINLGEPLLIFVGAIEDRPVVESGHLVVRPQLTLSIAYDHRVADGAVAARYTKDLRDALEALGTSPLRGRAGAALGKREVALSSGGLSYEMRLRSASHAWSLDEPKDLGGTSSGPSPVEALLGALQACLVITLKSVARRRDVAIERVESWAAANEQGHITSIALELDVWTPETTERMQELLARAERGCYVSGVLKPEIALEIDLRVHAPEASSKATPGGATTGG